MQNKMIPVNLATGLAPRKDVPPFGEIPKRGTRPSALPVIITPDRLAVPPGRFSRSHPSTKFTGIILNSATTIFSLPVGTHREKLADGGFNIRDIIVKTATNRAAVLGRPKTGRIFSRCVLGR